MSYFQKGAKVTICSDTEGKHPRRIGFVKRIGNGAWRLERASEWYNFDGKRVFPIGTKGEERFEAIQEREDERTTCFARPYQEGDEAAILIENERVKKYEELLAGKRAAEWVIRDAQSNMQYALRESDARVRRACENVSEAKRRLRYAEEALEEANREAEKAKARNEERKSTIALKQEQIAAIDAELARFGKEW